VRPVIEQALRYQDGNTEWVVKRDLLRNQLSVTARTVIPSRIEADFSAPAAVSCSPDGEIDYSISRPREIVIPAVDEYFHQVVPDYELGPYPETHAEDALAYAMARIWPKIAVNEERRRRRGEPSLGQEERMIREERLRQEAAEEAERQAELAYLAAEAKKEGERRQAELEAIPEWGLF
jgi:hypothetical protein